MNMGTLKTKLAALDLKTEGKRVLIMILSFISTIPIAGGVWAFWQFWFTGPVLPVVLMFVAGMLPYAWLIYKGFFLVGTVLVEVEDLNDAVFEDDDDDEEEVTE